MSVHTCSESFHCLSALYLLCNRWYTPSTCHFSGKSFVSKRELSQNPNILTNVYKTDALISDWKLFVQTNSKSAIKMLCLVQVFFFLIFCLITSAKLQTTALRRYTIRMCLTSSFIYICVHALGLFAQIHNIYIIFIYYIYCMLILDMKTYLVVFKD